MAKRNAVPRDHAPQAKAEAALHDVAVAGVEQSTRALDQLIHERMRLGIVSALAVNPVLGFTELKRLLDTTDGNLSVHARRLEEAGYIAGSRGFDGRVPRTEYRLTASGRLAFERYLEHMEQIIRAARPQHAASE